MEAYSRYLQENLITILVLNDRAIPLVANSVDTSLFDNKFYRRIAEVCINFYNKYKEAPKNHIVDLLHKELASEEGEIYKEILKNVFEFVNINVDFVISELEKFIKAQKLKQAIRRSYEEIERGHLDLAEKIIEDAMKIRLQSFDVGISLAQFPSYLMDTDDEEDAIYTGIKYLDLLGHHPCKKELFILLAPSGFGKTWFLIHLAKYALMQGKKVLYLTLEIGEKKLIRRFVQSLFAVPWQEVGEEIETRVFETTDEGYLSKIDVRRVVIRKDFSYAVERLSQFNNPNFIIKSFPSGTLTMRELKMYLENLKSIGFKPDILLLDYMDLMAMDVERLRLDIGRTTVDLRGLGEEEDFAVVTVTQTNREAENVKLITRKHIAEDFSRIRTADIFITYNRTKLEEKYGLARLYVDKSRNNKSGAVILISQNYTIGQFCISSALINDEYYDMLEEK